MRSNLTSQTRATLATALKAAAALAVGSAASPAGQLTHGPAAAEAAAKRANVVVLMTDDQTVDDRRGMSRTRSLVARRGVTFGKSYVSYPLCCPSRATYLTGQYPHNHRVMGLEPPTGGYGRFDKRNSLPVWLRRAGYHSAHIGKFLNGYGSDTPADVPPGWSEWYGAVDPTTYRMWGFTLNENGTRRTYGSPFLQDPRLYQTDVYRRKATLERHGARTLHGLRTRLATRFLALTAAIALNHRLGRPSRSLACYTA